MVLGYARRLLAAVAALLALAGPAAAQTGVIVGRVTDANSGLGVSSAEVRAVSATGAVAAQMLSNQTGQYRLANLTPGVYTVVVNAAGYREARVTDVSVAAGQTVNLPIPFEADVIAIARLEVQVQRGAVENVLESPHPIAVVPPERILERPSMQVFDILKGVPAIDLADTGLFTTVPVSRGFSNVFSTSLLSITDNRYTNVPSLRVNTGFLTPTVIEDIERVEVLLGPGSAVYGPNAANGVMHVITRNPIDYPGTTLAIGGGEREVLTGALRHAGVFGERFGYKITGQYMQGREWEFVDQEEVTARELDPSIPARDLDLRRWTGEVRLDYATTPTSVFNVNVGRATAENAIEMTPFGAAQAQGWDYTYYQARFRSSRFFSQAFVNTSDAGRTFLLRTGEPIEDQSRLYAAQFQYMTPFGDRQTFTGGIDVQRTDPRTNGTIHGRFEDQDDSDEFGAYLISDTRLTPQLRLSLTGRFDYHSRVEDNVISPRAALSFNPWRDHYFRASYNRAFGTPLNSQLFLDLFAGRVGALPFEIRAIGGYPGYNFVRDCGGICVRSPFAPDVSALMPLNAQPFWAVATNIVYQSTGGQVDIRGIPAPTAQQVPAVLRLLNPHPTGAFFQTVDPANLQDMRPLAPSISNTYEVGYKGVLGGRALLTVDVWHQQRNNFVSAALVETPNMFFRTDALAVYLGNFMSAAQAGQLAAVIGGVDGNPAATGIPLGTAALDHEFTNDPNIYVTYRNYGDVSLWGTDLGLEAHLPLEDMLPGQFTLSGTYSWLSDDELRTVGFFGQPVDVLLNSPATKGSVGLRWNHAQSGIALNSLVRFTAGFPMNSGVYVGEVEGNTVADVSASWRMRQLPGAMLTVQAQNIFDNRHQHFIGAPEIGRLITTRLMYTFGSGR
jgi:outer membrane receptor for ferrienterochelin and colicins